jgi:hypothetical protein
VAYVPQQLPENEQNIFGRKEQTTPNPIPPQTGGSAGGGTAGQGTAPGFGSSTQFGSNAAKLSDYLKANQEQVGQFGQQVAGNLTQGYNQAMGAIGQGVNQFNEQVGQGYTPYNQEQVTQAAEKPAEFAAKPENVSAFQNWWKGEYKGPQNFEGTGFYGDVNNQVNKAIENANLVGTQGGLGTYLGNNMGSPDTTEGMKTLDTALLMGNPGAQQAIKGAAAPYQNLTNYLGRQTQAANKNVSDVKANQTAQSQALQNQFLGEKGVIPTYEQNFTNQLGQARTNAATNTQDMIGRILVGNGTPEDLATLGLPGTQPMNELLYGPVNSLKSDFNQNFDLKNYFTNQNPEVEITPANFANPQDYANAAALAQLTGQDLGGFLNQANVGQAGTAPKTLANFDYQKASNEASTALNQQDNATLNSYPVGYAGSDPKTISMLKDVYQRNYQILNDNQAGWLKNQESKTTPPTTPLVDATHPPSGPPQPGETYISIPGGGYWHWNGSDWEKSATGPTYGIM